MERFKQTMLITETMVVYQSRVLSQRADKTKQNYRSVTSSLIDAVGDIPLELIGEEQIILWKQYMTENGCSGTTQRGYLMSFRQVLKYFNKAGVISFDPYSIDMPANDTKPRTFLKADEVQSLINAAKNPRDKAIIACTFITGTRISEILDLDRADLLSPVDEDGLLEVTVKGKRGKYRPVFFNETARMYLDNYLETRTDRYKPLFISGQNRRITVSRVEQIIHECARRAGLDKVVTPHVLRHSFATDLLKNKAPLYDVSKMLGHANIATTANIYGHYDTEARKQTFLSKQTPLA